MGRRPVYSPPVAFRDLNEEILAEFADAAGRGSQHFILRPGMRGSPEDLFDADPRLFHGKENVAEYVASLRAERRARGQCAHCGSPSPDRYRCLVCSIRQKRWDGSNIERLTREGAALRRVKRNILRHSHGLNRRVPSIEVWLKGQQEIAGLNFQGVGIVPLCKSKLRLKSKTWARHVRSKSPPSREPRILRINLGRGLSVGKKRPYGIYTELAERYVLDHPEGVTTHEVAMAIGQRGAYTTLRLVARTRSTIEHVAGKWFPKPPHLGAPRPRKRFDRNPCQCPLMPGGRLHRHAETCPIRTPPKKPTGKPRGRPRGGAG